MQKVYKGKIAIVEISNSGLLPKQWIAAASLLPTIQNPPRGVVVLYMAHRLTPELMGDRRKLDDDELLLGRMHLKELTGMGPATALAIRDSLNDLLDEVIIEEPLPPSSR